MSHATVSHAAVLIGILFLTGVLGLPTALSAQSGETIAELRDKINNRVSEIEQIEKEIEVFQNDLNEIGKEKTSLQSAVKTLDISARKLSANIDVTQNRISATTFQIEKLALEISDREREILLHSETLAESIRQIYEAEENTFVESLLGYEDLSQLWEQVEDLQRFQILLRKNLIELRASKGELVGSKSEREGRRRELTNFEYELDNQKKVVDITKREKNVLLTQTKNKESNYKSLLEEKIAARKQFEKELLDFESKLQIAIDPSSIPTPGSKVLAPPLDSIKVTQNFGDTEFARSGAYKGKGHNGVDFRASPGTSVRSVLNGTITATGNTDAVRGCYSYGKWILVKHNNGLSSLYAHLSHISVGRGDQVLTGQVIGYSGNTGYSTGPHLHLGLFVTQGVQVVRFGDIKVETNCADATIPVAPHEAYLDPLSYL